MPNQLKIITIPIFKIKFLKLINGPSLKNVTNCLKLKKSKNSCLPSVTINYKDTTTEFQKSEAFLIVRTSGELL